MKVRSDKARHDSKQPDTGFTNFSLGKLEISTEEILADLRYPAPPRRRAR